MLEGLTKLADSIEELRKDLERLTRAAKEREKETLSKLTKGANYESTNCDTYVDNDPDHDFLDDAS